MHITIVYLYNQLLQSTKFLKDVLEKIKDSENDWKVATIKSCNEAELYGKAVEKLDLDIRENKISAALYDDIYKMLSDNSDIDVMILPVEKWQDLQFVTKSQLQLANKHVLFCLKQVPDKDIKSFVKLMDSLSRFSNIHVAIEEEFVVEEYEKLHFLEKEDINEIIKLKGNNRRKHIGWRYHLDELCQKIKFHKDLLYCCFRVKFCNKYKEKFEPIGDIPKVIHYCWFGGKEIPANLQKYIDGWKEKLPGYEFKLWSEENFPIEKYHFAQEAFLNKKWAFISDVARLHALYYEGGFYLDTDIEVLKSLDPFLKEECFVTYGTLDHICATTMGAHKHAPFIGQLLLWYDCVHCDEDYWEIANAKIITKLTRYLYGVKTDGKDLHLPGKTHVYPREYFFPDENKNGYIVTENTHCIHHQTGLW